MKNLPTIDLASLQHSQRVQSHLMQLIQQRQWIPFSTWMHECLYAPGIGYYMTGNIKFAQNDASHQGDFITAPQLSPLFAWALAQQVVEILQLSQSNQVLEFGAGTGELAYGILHTLKQQDIAVQYFILDLSGELQSRQQARLAEFADQITWIDTLPEAFNGCVLANEILDAMPTEIVTWNAQQEAEIIGVTVDDTMNVCWQQRPAPSHLAQLMQARLPALAGYRTEINIQAETWMRHMATWLTKGAAILIDYGFPQHEFYHPQRHEGTLMCHLRHTAHGNPLIYPGIQDITSHVDFTAMADAAYAGGLDIIGYTSQARFLMNLGIVEAFTHTRFDSPAQQLHASQALQKLLAEGEMGELFKVLIVGKNIAPVQRGFIQGDRLHTL